MHPEPTDPTDRQRRQVLALGAGLGTAPAPVTTGTTEQDYAWNRRVEIRF